jgi:hypothetical protein
VLCTQKIATESPPGRGEGRQALGVGCGVQIDRPTPTLRAIPPDEGISLEETRKLIKRVRRLLEVFQRVQLETADNLHKPHRVSETIEYRCKNRDEIPLLDDGLGLSSCQDFCHFRSLVLK